MTLSSRCLCVSSACLCGSGWTSWETLTSSSMSTWRRWWMLRCTSSHRPSWTPAPRRSTSWAEWASVRSKSAMFVTLWMSLREKRSGPFFNYNHNYPLQFLWFQQFPAILNQICDPFIYQLSKFLFWTQEKNLRAPESQMMSTFCRHLKCVKVDIWLCSVDFCDCWSNQRFFQAIYGCQINNREDAEVKVSSLSPSCGRFSCNRSKDCLDF